MKSTHRGHCQACGRLQMLPGGKLSLHGYKVEFGFFSGTCCGSQHKPFEKSCDMLPQFVANAQRSLESLESHQKELRKMPTQPTAWIRVRYASGPISWQKTWTEWTRCPMTIARNPYSDGDGFSYVYSYTDKNGEVHTDNLSTGCSGIKAYDANGRTDEEVLLASCLQHNERRANWLEHEADSLRRYIKWQLERIGSWKEAELLPVDAKDKAGFVPTEAAY